MVNEEADETNEENVEEKTEKNVEDRIENIIVELEEQDSRFQDLYFY